MMTHSPGLEDMPSSESAASPDSKTPSTEVGQPENDGETLSVPMELLGGKKFKAGDSITFKVVTSDQDGLEVAYSNESEGKKDSSAHDELDSMAAADSSDY